MSAWKAELSESAVYSGCEGSSEALPLSLSVARESLGQ